MYITVEGPIGVGKSSLANLIHTEFNYSLINEIITENPFLERFYQDQERWAFQTEMYFLSHRYLQLKSLETRINQNQNFVADYDICKNKIFADKTLDNSDLHKFNQIYTNFKNDLVNNDLTIFLKTDLATLKQRIKMRNRNFEQDIADEYLEYLIKAYNNELELFKKNRPNNFLVIECSNLDFVNNRNDRQTIIKKIQEKTRSLQNEI